MKLDDLIRSGQRRHGEVTRQERLRDWIANRNGLEFWLLVAMLANFGSALILIGWGAYLALRGLTTICPK